jgi:hemolysin activation/secretion protein
VESDRLQNLTIKATAEYHRRQTERRLFYASVSGIFGNNLDIDNQILLGGDNGLRGYPLRYLSGDSSALLTIEQRFFSDWYPFRLFRVGAAVFFDAGRSWGPSLAGYENPGILTDIGFGLRLGNMRSGLGRMIHIDLAFPLNGDESIDSVQLLIEAKSSF